MGKNFDIVNVFNNLEENRANAITTELNNGVVVDTCMCGDTQEFETGILCKKDNSWVIVEQYGMDKEKAAKGHRKYVDLINAGTTKFRCIQLEETIDILED